MMAVRRPLIGRVIGYRSIQVLEFVRAYCAEHDGRAPTYAEICAGCGIRTEGDVSRIIKSLEQRGLLSRSRGGIGRKGRRILMVWQTIETAPRDGTVILLLVGGRPYVGRYFCEEQFEFGKLARKREGWSLFGAMTLVGCQEPEPTHWLPIPLLKEEPEDWPLPAEKEK